MFTFPGGNDCIYTAILFSPSGEIPIHSNISTHVEKVVWEGNAKTDKKKLVVDEDYAKKVATDALTKGLSKWGFNADVFEGKFDDDKYVKSLEMEQAKNFDPSFDCLKDVADLDALKEAWENNKDLHENPKFVEEKDKLKAKIQNDNS